MIDAVVLPFQTWCNLRPFSADFYPQKFQDLLKIPFLTLTNDTHYEAKSPLWKSQLYNVGTTMFFF